jgi:hypothetical protein
LSPKRLLSEIELAASYACGEFFYVCGERAVVCEFRDVSADGIVAAQCAATGLEREAMFESFGGAEQFDGEDVLDV